MFFLLFLLSIPLHSQEWKQNLKQTEVTFQIKNFGIDVDGNFNEIDIQTNFTFNTISSSYIRATIPVKSITTGIKKRDEHILKEGYFDEGKHKNILLKSDKIEKTLDGKFLLYADLTIKETTKKIQVPLSVEVVGNTITMKSSFEINRKDFKVGGGSLVMSKKVKIQVVYSGTK